MALKFIINNNKIILGDVIYHLELVTEGLKKEETIGGGRYLVYPELYGDIVFFYGSSFEFGKLNKEQFDLALTNSQLLPEWKDYKIIFSEKESFSDVLKEQNI